MSDVLQTLKRTEESLGSKVVPQFKYFSRFLNNNRSRECWTSLNHNETANPFLVLDFPTDT